MTADAHRERCDKAFEFQGAATVALATMRRIAMDGHVFHWQPVLTPEARLEAIAKYCDEMLAKIPAELREYAAKL